MQAGMIGQTLLHYRLTDKIGEGGMGAVYKAVDTHLDRPVALKILPPEKTADPERKRRFIQEAKAASALQHPNIVVIHDIASDQGRDFIVMEFVEGKSLDDLVGRKGRPLGEALNWAVQIADGLARAHAAGIVHRDLKPPNVMVTDEGLVKILDFGLAKLVEDDAEPAAGPTMTMGREAKPLTEEGMILGTVAYMSPEQAEGKKVDARSDVFSFGAVLYEMLTGIKAFDRGSRMKTLAAVLNEDPRPAASVNETIPAEMERIIARCLRKDFQRRWQTMSDLKVALQDLKEDSESGKLEAVRISPKGGKKRALLLAVPSVLLALAAAAVVLKQFVFKPTPALEYELTPVTYDAGVTSSPTISLDGSLMAYASDRDGGHFDIYVQRVAGGKPLRLTDHPADDWFPSFSPDGSQIAFRSERDGGGIDLIDALGGEPRRISGRGFIPRFSPDGRWIASVVVPASNEGRLTKMVLISPRTGETKPFLPDFMIGLAGQGAGPVWSPDGKSVLFRGRRLDDPRSTDWWIAPVDGGDVVRTQAIINLGLNMPVQYPVGWTGESVYFVSGTTIDGVNLFRASLNPKEGIIRGPATPVTTGPGMKIYPAVLPDGRIFFTDMRVRMNARSVAARPDEVVVTGRPEKLTEDMMQHFSPSVSRDGSQAAFIAFGGAKTARIEIRIKNMKNGRERSVPLQSLILEGAVLSPDGSTLAYQDKVGGKFRAHILEQGASAGREVCESCAVLDFFPDNKQALVQTGPEKAGRMDLGTGAITPLLAASGESILDAGLSPDARWIGWLAGMPDGRAAIRIAAIEGLSGGNGETMTVAEADYYLSAPSWSPNGRWLYFLSEKTGACSLYAQELDDRTKRPVGEAREVLRSPESRLRLNFPLGLGRVRVAADKIVLMMSEMEGNIFLAAPKKRE